MLKRIWLIASRDFVTYLRRPMVWVWMALLLLLYWGISTGNVQVASGGDASIGGTKQHLNSEFEIARFMSAFNMIINSFFVSVLFGMAVIRDYDSGIMPLFSSSQLKAWEYLAGKFLGCMAVVVFLLIYTVLVIGFFFDMLPHPAKEDFYGPANWANYWKPTLKLVLPSLLLMGSVAFALGTLTRKPILVFAFPTMMLLVFGLFLNNWSPIWLPVWANNMLNMLDPFGTRWLNETYFNVDRGADFYNTQSVALDIQFLISRFAHAAIAGSIALIAIPLFGRKLRGARHGSLQAVDQPSVSHQERSGASTRAVQAGLSSLQMQQRRGTVVADTWNIMRYELKELRFSPALYLFVPFIIIEVVGSSLFEEGAFGTPLLHTSGGLAVNAMGTLSILGCLLLMFYTVESQMRERVKKLAPIYYSTQARSFSMLLGKSLANAGMCAVIVFAAFVACFFLMMFQGTVQFEILPFLVVWGLLVMPTFILWSAFITLAIVVTRNRYTTYAIGAGALIATLYYTIKGDMNWLTNWMLTGAMQWSDISVLELDRPALILNRLFVLSLAVFLTYVAARVYWRRGYDAVQVATRMRVKPVFGYVFRALPVVLIPVVLGSVLWHRVQYGHQGKAISDREEKYHRQNANTWRDVDPPSVSGVDVVLDVQPEAQALSVVGTLRLTNDQDEPMDRFVLTTGAHWKNIQWKLSPKSVVGDELSSIPATDDLEKIDPEEKSGLYIFDLTPSLEPGESVRLQYSFDGRFPDGISKNGGNQGEFILPSGVVLTSFGVSFLPQPGFSEDVGLEDPPEPKVYQQDFHEEQLDPLFGGGDHFHVRTTITGPEDFTFNGVGVKQSESVDEGRKTVVWQSDSPIAFFNVVGGRWQVHRGESTEIYYDPKHDYNVEQISAALEAARVWYSRWFAPYPWKELRLNEFPDMSTYAQGFATNITFSEGIGFLTKDKAGADAPFMVAAHEAAHQWWGNILVPGEGPGGNILSEGMAHFSTGLLFEQEKGLRGRIDFFKLIEKQYGERRSVDSERAMIFVDGSKTGDTTVMYDRGGWVFWMLLNEMGRRDNLQGIQTFIRKYSQDVDDYPVLQDFVIHMREFARDKPSFDRFVDQWIFDTVLPEFQLSDIKREQRDGKWLVTGTVKNVGTGTVNLELAGAVNERFDENEPADDYQDARTAIEISENESVEFSIECNFKPDRFLVDPDACVLQLKRKRAEHRFD